MSNILEIDSLFTNLKQKVIDLESDMMEEIKAKDATIASLRAKVIHCDKCGASWYDDGFTPSCPSCTITALRAEVERLKDILEDHGPDGHNATNAQFVALRTRAEAAEAKVERVREWFAGVLDYNPKGKDVCWEVDYDDIVALKQLLK